LLWIILERCIAGIRQVVSEAPYNSFSITQ